MKEICIAMCGAFHDHKKVLEQIKKLKKNYSIFPVVSECVAEANINLILELEKLTGNSVVNTYTSAERLCFGTKSSCLVIAPCTGNTLAKIANAITDNSVTMIAKSHMRNNKPIVIGISTNDGLGLNMFNLAKLFNQKNIFFVPFKQDDAEHKPKSLMCDFALLEQTISFALKNKQVQPILI